MINYKYPLCNDTWSREEFEALYEVINSNKLTMGEITRNYEIKFAEYFKTKYAVMFNSGSSANLIAIASLIYSNKLQKGDEILVTAVSWSTTYFPLLQYGLKIKFVDIDLFTLNADLTCLEEAITAKTRAILAVNLLGNPNDFDRVLAICERHDILLIEDNCESMGAKFNNKFCGTFGIIGTFSTYFSHHICTIEGGVAVTESKELFEIMLSLRSHGWTRQLPQDSIIYQKNQNPFYESFNFILPGYNVRPLEIEAAIGLKQINKLDNIIDVRRKNAIVFNKMFQDNENIITQKEIGKSSWFGFSIILTNKLKNKRDQVINLLYQNGIEVRPVVAGNFTKNTVIKYFDYEISKKLENADYLHENGFFVGNHSKPINECFNYLNDVISLL